MTETRGPLVGMPARMDADSESQYLSRRYGDAVAGAGGVPVILPLLDDPEALRSAVAALDGIVLTGSGTDVDPARYGSAREPGCGPVQPLRDRTDFVLLELAAQRRLPVLAICYGMQALNVYRGGSLIQDIPSAVETPIAHQNPGSHGRPSHPITIVPGTILSELAEGDSALVNSTHHQAADRIGSGLQVIARAPDGIVEAVVGNGPGPLVLGVQWHPEKSFAIDALSRRIFDLFLSRCRSEM
jgi:putative glutamine amidotransferase